MQRGRWMGLTLALAACLLSVAGCGARKSSPDSIYGVADVLSITVRASSPQSERASVTLVGTLPDSCTSIASVRQSLENRSLTVTVTTRRPIEGLCEQRAVAFEKTVPLVLRGLRPGEYSIVCGGVEAPFLIDQGDVVTPL